MTSKMRVRVRATFHLVTMVVYLCLVTDEEGVYQVVTSMPVPAPEGRDASKVELEDDDAFGFFFADRYELWVEEGASVAAGTYVLETEGEDGSSCGRNLSQVFFRPDRCTIGSAADFLCEHPGDTWLANEVLTERGQRMVRVTLRDEEGKEISRYYEPIQPEDMLLEVGEDANVGADEERVPSYTSWSSEPVVGSA